MSYTPPPIKMCAITVRIILQIKLQSNFFQQSNMSTVYCLKLEYYGKWYNDLLSDERSDEVKISKIYK